MTIEKYDRSGGYKYVAYDNDGKVLIITSSKIALKTDINNLVAIWSGFGFIQFSRGTIWVPEFNSIGHL